MEIADNLVISIIFSDSQIILELFLNKLFGAFMDFNYLFLLSQYLFRNNSITYDLQKVYGSEKRLNFINQFYLVENIEF